MASEAKLGEIPSAAAERDAVHVAVYPCVASVNLIAGMKVKIEGGKAVPCDLGAIGIVDPFLVGGVKSGMRCYVCLYPGSVVGMRHHWRHPAFDGDKAQSEEWLREYARSCNAYDEPEQAFDRLISCLRGRELFFNGTDCHGMYDVEQADELKRHAETYLGIPINWDEFGFSCSC